MKAVIFDLDGTIVTFNLDFKTMRAEVRGYLLKMGVPASLLSVNESMFEMLRKTEIFMKNRGKTQVMDELRCEALSIAARYEVEAATHTSLLPGAVETLKSLKAQGLKIGVCTVNSEKSTEYILSRFKVTEYFDAVISRDRVSQVKPNPEHLGATLKALGVSADEAVVVGDSVVDMQAARELKIISAGLPTGVSTAEQLTRHGANFIVTSITDLPALIQRIDQAETEA
ncbi:MAG: HAD family hydrolase [Candidatus Bathyarchaeia archaeon]